MSCRREDKRYLQIDCKQPGIIHSNLDVPEHEEKHIKYALIERKSQLALEEKQIGEVDLFEPALEDSQFRLATEEAVLKKSIAIVDTGLSVEKENIQDMNKSLLVYSIFTFRLKELKETKVRNTLTGESALCGISSRPSGARLTIESSKQTNFGLQMNISLIEFL